MLAHALVLLALVTPVRAQDPAAGLVGDVGGDGRVSGADAVGLIAHLRALRFVARERLLAADVDGDGFIAPEDLGPLHDRILQRDDATTPPTRFLETSPADGERDVAVTRETILRLTRPLRAGVVPTLDDVFAEFAGARLPSILRVSARRDTITLFHPEGLPASARLRVTVRGDALTDVLGRRVDADGDGVDGGTAVLEFDTVNLAPLPATAVTGRVFASKLAPGGTVTEVLPGVTITVDGTEDALRTTTDAFGNFRLEPVPAGKFFVHVDGRTAQVTVPEEAYYTSMGKLWTAVPGVVTDVGDVFIPLVPPGALQPVSDTVETVVKFAPATLEAHPDHPELAQVSLTVPAGALFADDGTVGGRVGIVPVAPDQLPGKLPTALAFTQVITVQTDGPTNFDEPASACFPNLADPLTGLMLSPGSKTALWSFNDDTGRFEVVGPATVSPDGLLVCTDPGIGIMAPGWLGMLPGVEVAGGFAEYAEAPVIAQGQVDGARGPDSLDSRDSALPLESARAGEPAPGDVSVLAAEGRLPGLFYFAVENLDSGGIEQRGVAGSNGVLHDSLVLAPGTAYRDWFLRAATLEIGTVTILTGSSGTKLRLGEVTFFAPGTGDTDGDGLHDVGELIVGTSATDPDTDDDGVADGPEVVQGLDPLDRLVVRTGIVASAGMASPALDACALDYVTAVAGGAGGVTVFNVFSGLNPVIVAQVDTPGSGEAVACGTNVVAVADGSAGLAIVDITNPAEPDRRNVEVGGSVRCVVVAATRAFVGLASSAVAAVDLVTGGVLETQVVDSPVHDLALEGNTLFALTRDRLHAFDVSLGVPEPLGSVALSAVAADGLTGRKRLSVGGGIARATCLAGFDAFDVSDPAAMVRIGVVTGGGPSSFKQVVANGSGLGVAAVGAQPIADGTHDVWLYDLTDPSVTTDLVTVIETPGTARALSIYNGLAYVADGESGLQVVNYLAYDTAGVPPTVALRTSSSGGVVEEGQLFTVAADVSDDVQVRAVEFFLDGVLVATDGNYPFEHRLITPLRSTATSFTLRARAVDTGGNAATTPDLVIAVVTDARTPFVVATVPAAGAFVALGSSPAAFFSEPMTPASITAGGLTVKGAGADGMLGTLDDVTVAGAAVPGVDLLAAYFMPSLPLPPGAHRARVAGVRDLAGNPIAAPYEWSFFVLAAVAVDADGDLLRDDAEGAFGLDPARADTDGDGILDGNEDGDGDGLVNRGEILLGTSPSSQDTDGDGVLDGAEDSDADGATDGAEIAPGSDPFDADSDDDGFLDGLEIALGASATSAGSRPVLPQVAGGTAFVVRPVPPAVPAGAVAAGHGVAVVLPDATDPALSANTKLAQPPVGVDRP